ncbi:hypothetical protein AB2H58_25610 (plasmid) [Escherichia coli]
MSYRRAGASAGNPGGHWMALRWDGETMKNDVFSGLQAGMWPVSGCIGIRVQNLSGAIAAMNWFHCHFYLSAAVIAPNAFWRCVQCDVMVNGADFQEGVILTTRTLCK